MTARTRTALRAAKVGLAAPLLVLAGVACQSEQARFDGYLASAHAALARPGGEETAIIQLLNALQIRPDSAEVNFRLGQAHQNQGQLRDAIFFYEEAHHLDPEATQTTVELALLLRLTDERRAIALLKDARERDPENPWVHAAQAELALDRENPAEAVRAAERAVEIDPDFSFGYLALGRAHMGKIYIAQLLGERAPDADFRGAQSAFERFSQLSPPRERWNSLIERARVFAAWPGHAAEALSAFREALAAADEDAPKAGKLRVASRVLEFARARNEDELRADALERLVELEPEHLAHWDELALVRQLGSGGGGDTLRRLTEEQPDNPEAHLRYAGYLRATEGPAAAIEYLAELSFRDELRAPLLGALAQIYDATGQGEDRDAALADLEDEYPFHPTTLLARARRSFEQGRVEDAVLDLRVLTERSDGAEAERLLAYAEFALGNYRASLDATSRAMERNPRLGRELLELRAGAAYALDDCAIAGRTLARLLALDRLSERKQVQLAHCFYETGRKRHGRKLLQRLLALDQPPVEAVLEFALREMDHAAQREFIRRELREAQARDPGNPRLVLHMAEAQRRDGLIQEGIAELDRAILRDDIGPTPKLLLLRARLHSEAGDLQSAERDARRALALDPAMPGALHFYVATLTSLGRLDMAIGAMQQQQRKEMLNANDTALLGRLYLKAGRRGAARQALELAYRMGCRLPDVLNTLAFMLATDGERLKSALRMAQLAVEASETPNSLDTLGFVYLRLGQPETALEYFDRAVVQSAPPESSEPERSVAGFHFRRGLALQALGRAADATTAFERAHALDPTRPRNPPPAPAARSQPNSGAAGSAATAGG